MIFNTTLFDSFINPSGYNVGGCKRIFLTEAIEVGLYNVVDRQIVNLTANEPWSVLEDLNGLTFTVKTEPTKGGTIYSVDVAFGISVLRADANYILEALSNSEYTAIMEDLNGRFWLLGYREGLKTTYEMLSDDGGYAVKMNTKQRNRIEEVSLPVMLDLELYNYYESTTPNPIYSQHLTPSNGGSGGGFTGPLNVFETVVISSSAYVISDDDHFIKVMNAATLNLPSSPSPGQQHIIKAYYNAEVGNVVIVPADGHKIDNQNSALINTDMGSLTLIFQGGHWSTVAFAI